MVGLLLPDGSQLPEQERDLCRELALGGIPQGAAKASIITSSEITPDSEMATVICQIKNAFIINPINGKAEMCIRDSITSMRLKCRLSTITVT